MEATITIDKEELDAYPLNIKDEYVITNLIEKKLIGQKKIDTNLYEISTIKIGMSRNYRLDKIIYHFEYELLRREDWNDLDKAEGRLERGI